MSMILFTRRAFGRGGGRALALAAALCLCSPVAFAAEVHVKIDNFTFTPASVAVKPGDTVVWENGDDIPHNVVSSDKAMFRAKVMDTGEKFSFTFSAAGTFEYFCALHPHMQGEIKVAP